MKRLVFAAASIGLAAAPAMACDRSYSFPSAVALAVPLVVEDAFGAHVVVAPLVDPLVVVSRPVFVPRVRVFSPRPQVRLRGR